MPKGPKPRSEGHLALGELHSLLRHDIWKRDEGSCSFVSRGGRRCGSHDFLEFDHLKPWAVNPRHSSSGIALRCRDHNQAAARKLFGDRHMDRLSRPSARGSEQLVSDQVGPES